MGIEDRKEATNEAVSDIVLMENLSEQQWHDIGNSPYPIGATDDFDTMVNQLTAILSCRLLELVVAHCRKLRHVYLVSLVKEKPEDEPKLARALRANLRDYVARIGEDYRNVHYHSFEHATHVTISMNKMISSLILEGDSGNAKKGGRQRRSTMQHVVSPNHEPNHREKLRRHSSMSIETDDGNNEVPHEVDDATFNMARNSMLKFAMVFSALIHDVQHQGVSNATLVDEEDEIAIRHNDISVAEQHSLQIAFSYLMNKKFAALKEAIMPDKESRKVFRKHVINIVLSTDISNTERIQINESRWKEAFGPDALDIHNLEQQDEENSSHSNETKVAIERRRHSMYTAPMSNVQLQNVRLGIRQTLQLTGGMINSYACTSEGQRLLRQHAVTDLMMNIADVAHTMQGFNVFLKWNRRLYKEFLYAYHYDRNSFDPTLGWYQNQINFYDFYIIPLAEKIDQCGVLGNKGSLMLYYAMDNKRKWTDDGQKITEEMIEEVGKEMIMEMMSKSSINGGERDAVE